MSTRELVSEAMKTFKQFNEDIQSSRGYIGADFVGTNSVTIGLNPRNKYTIEFLDKDDFLHLGRGKQLRGPVTRTVDGKKQDMGEGMLYTVGGELILRAPGDMNFASIPRVNGQFFRDMHTSVSVDDGFHDSNVRVDFSVGDR